MVQIVKAMDRIHVLNHQEIEALVKGDFVRLARLRRMVKRARDRKGALLDKYDEHVRGHGC